MRYRQLILLGSISLLLAISGCTEDSPVSGSRPPFWEEFYYQFAEGGVRYLAIDQQDRIFAGVDYQGIGYSIGPSSGVFVSCDGGENWEYTGLCEYYISSLLISPAGFLYAGVTSTGVSRSGNGGASWTMLGLDLTDRRRCYLAVDDAGGVYVGTQKGDVYRSPDNGDTWVLAREGLDDDGDDDIYSIAVNSEGYLFIGTRSQGLFRSIDQGDSWERVKYDASERESMYDVWIDRADRVFARTSEGFYRSRDGGDTWEEVIIEYDGWRVWPSSFWSDNRGEIFIGEWRGVFKSIDGGESWERIDNGLVVKAVEAIVTNTAGEVFAATRIGVYRSDSAYENWQVAGLGDRPHSFLTPPSGNIFVLDWNGLLFVSRDGGASWQQFNAGIGTPGVVCLTSAGAGTLIAGTTHGVYRSLESEPCWTSVGLESCSIRAVCAPGGDRILAGAKDGVYTTADGGATWSFLGMAGYHISSLALDTRGRVYAGTAYGGIFRYSGGGMIWDQVNTGLTNLSIVRLLPRGDRSLVAGTLYGGIFTLSHSGIEWEPRGLEGNYITSLTVDEYGCVFVGTGEGLAYSVDDFRSWERLSGGLPYRNVDYLSVGVDGHLYALSRYLIYRSSESVYRSINIYW